MAQPVWQTSAGTLGTIPEGVFYRISISAIDPDGGDVFYRLIAGSLPSGIQLTSNGIVEGTPQNIVTVQGVPTEVNENVTSKFAIRAYTVKTVNGSTVVDRINDRTFTITVTGQDIPEFITPAGSIGDFYDGTEFEFQIEFSDNDPIDTVSVNLLSGELPAGLTLTRSGLITGVIEPLAGPETADDGYDLSQYDQYPFDFQALGTSRNFQFTVEITDGKESNVRTFEMFVYAQGTLTADNIVVDGDNVFITADGIVLWTPLLLTPPGSLGTIKTDNFFAFQFTSIDFNNDPVEYVLDVGGDLSLPPGLQLDSTTGWLYGFLSDLGAVENSYQFGIQVRKANSPDIISSVDYFSISTVGSIEGAVSWVTESDLGVINNGDISTLSVVASATSGVDLLYRIPSDSTSKLPQGLFLLPSGNIVGRVSFNTFCLDGGTTTFDKESRTVITDTEFDSEFRFTVNAYAPNTEVDSGSSGENAISIFRTFVVRVKRTFNQPYETLYIKAMPPHEDRNLLKQLTQNQDIIPMQDLYRADDPYFGIAQSVRYNHAYGLTASSLEQYVSALGENHYWKNLVLGNVDWAIARDSSGRIIYEVVYSKVVDNLVNNRGESVSKSITLPAEVQDVAGTALVYPNSLENMRNQVIDTVGQQASVLPTWMTSKQSDGTVLGFTPAWVIAYVKPGQGAKTVYNIRQKFGQQLNQIDFRVDRYEIDRSASFAWDPETLVWGTGIPQSTSFDQNSTIFDSGATEFVTPSNTVISTDVYDKYLVFPKINILG